jgi:hypothetical protein
VQKYEAESAKDKARYQREMAAYKANHEANHDAHRIDNRASSNEGDEVEELTQRTAESSLTEPGGSV